MGAVYHSSVCYNQEVQAVKAQLGCGGRRHQPIPQHQPPGSGFMCPCHDQLVMQSLPTMISRHYLLYFNFYKSMLCYFKTLQLKACLDRKMWQILPPPFKSMHSQVLNCTYRVIDFDDNHSCTQNIWSEMCQVRSQSVLWFEGDDNDNNDDYNQDLH